jgi:hypothetical protein
LLEAVAIELGHPFEEVPQEQQTPCVHRVVCGEQFVQRLGIEVREMQCVGGAVVERRVAVLEQRRDLGVDRPEHDQSAVDSRVRGDEAVHFGLEVGTELGEDLAVEVLELVDGHDEAGANQ